ncbi:MAG: hypothetical protein KGQ41_01525 [Alphaproteobacteria bacterium]|nr:hypothetical protein [Alphaproteobacteria bacterium]
MVAIVSLAGYLPQIVALIKAKSPHDNISLQSWYTWVFTYCISLGYGLFHLHDTLFIVNTAFGLTAILAVIGLVSYNRYYRFKHLPAAAE